MTASILPMAFTCPARSRTWARSDRSPTVAIAPRATRSSTAESRLRERAWTTTSWPSASRLTAAACPRPVVDPVMKTRRLPGPRSRAGWSFACRPGINCARAGGGAARRVAAAAPRPMSTPAARSRRRETRAQPGRPVSARIGVSLLHVRLVAGPVGRIGRVETRQGGAGLDLFHDPALETLLLEREGRDLLHQGGGHQHGAVPVGDDHVVRKDGHPAATHGLLPVD